MNWEKFVESLDYSEFHVLASVMKRNEYNKLLPDLTDPEKCLARCGHKIQAIKMYRDRVGCGLKEAKDKCAVYFPEEKY